MVEQTCWSFQQSTGCWNVSHCQADLQKHTKLSMSQTLITQNKCSLSLNKEVTIFFAALTYCTSAFWPSSLDRPHYSPILDGLTQHLCGRALGCMWASSNSALQSPYAATAKWLPWHARLLRRKELLHTDRSAMTLHGQLRSQRGALCRAWPPLGSLSHGGKH